MDIREVEEHVKYRIANAEIRRYPYPHFFIENIFPDEYYAQILANWPGADRFRSIAETGRVGTAYKERHIVSLVKVDQEEDEWKGKEFWQAFAGWFVGRSFLQFLVTHFQPVIAKVRTLPPKTGVEADGLLVQDHSNYAIGPHTDAPHRLVSTLFYCPPDDSQKHLGTSVYVPNTDKIPREISGVHYDREHFVKIQTAPFIPNSMFGFVISPNSFHGVDLITDENVRRNVILHFVKANTPV
jgi:hypothetical protein